ncbi:hypothetical protein [Mangrovihabitans endophyticus]|uniref:Uncharacterized protein n=1 Tax=Mangrovihabitans endophyticus TaxID=1751298 RepID=A0A8J3BYA8_9ACTN|nr:hypothetical protein [Mangrovihabitans endophyticus]GGK91512.1 hypothetical protein GCM10012284_26720 [Mangrovihabitans endophyticus]
MFRLVRLEAQHPEAPASAPRIVVDRDGYASEYAALARYRAFPLTWFGVGRFDEAGGLAEIIMDGLCGPVGGCPRPAVTVHARTYRRLCDVCAFGLEALTLPELAAQLGVAVRLAPVLARSGRGGADTPAVTVSNRIAGEFALGVADPSWRAALCRELARNPMAVNGVIIGAGALSHREVLDLFPALRALGAQLPRRVRGDLARAGARPLSPAGVAARRLWL